MTTGLAYWGQHFPDAAARSLYWDGHFPDDQFNPAVVPGVGPVGAATFALDLTDGTRVKLSWKTDIIKAYDGVERQRIAIYDLPCSSYAGQAYLLGGGLRATRAALARYAAQGQPFRIGLTYEGASLVKDATGTTIHVPSTAELDWAVLGQRVLVVPTSDEDSDDVGPAVAAVIQSFTSNTIVLDVAPGAVGRAGGLVMPSVAVFLNPQQGFGRYPNPGGVEEWHIDAKNITFGFEQQCKNAFVALTGFTGGAFHNATAFFTECGTIGNGVELQTQTQTEFTHGFVTRSGPAVIFHYRSGFSTVGDMVNALRAYNIAFTGSLNLATVMTSPIDTFGPAAMAGGVDQIWGNMGVGATLSSFEGVPVWDRGIQVGGDGAGQDSLQSMAEVVELGAVPFDVGVALESDWGRQASIQSEDPGEWQWLKLFLSTVHGRQGSFWLPTGRPDLIGISLAPGASGGGVNVTPGILKIEGPSADAGDFFGWYPAMRDHVRVKLGDGRVGYLDILGATDNGDGTIDLQVTTSIAGYNVGDLSGSPTLSNLDLTSWMDRCRFESDDFDIEWRGAQFAMKAQARAVNQ